MWMKKSIIDYGYCTNSVCWYWVSSLSDNKNYQMFYWLIFTNMISYGKVLYPHLVPWLYPLAQVSCVKYNKEMETKNCHLRWLSLVQCSQLWVLHLSDILEPVIPTCKLSSSYENITIMVMYFRYVPNQMAPLTIVLSFILAIAANLPRFFELQVMNMFFILMRLSYISNDDVTHLLSR